MVSSSEVFNIIVTGNMKKFKVIKTRIILPISHVVNPDAWPPKYPVHRILFLQHKRDWGTDDKSLGVGGTVQKHS